MNRLLIAALAVIACVPAFAATIVEPVVPKTLSDSPMDAGKPLPEEPPPPRPAENERRAQGDADARPCLNLPTNRQVHACAERYRTRVARARAAKAVTAVKPAAAAPAPPKTSDVINLPPLKTPAPLPPAQPGAPQPPTPGIAPKAPDPTKK